MTPAVIPLLRTPYGEPRLKQLTVKHVDQPWTTYQVSLEVIAGDAADPRTGDRAVAMLSGIEEMHQQPDNPIDSGRIARAEFIRNEMLGRRGVVFYDNRGVPLIHVVHALLGYDGSGPDLSRRLLETLGVSELEFDEVNREVGGQDYVVIFSREQHEERGWVDLPTPWADVRDEWEHWHA